MSEFISEDWKLKARTVVKLYRKNIYMFVSVFGHSCTSEFIYWHYFPVSFNSNYFIQSRCVVRLQGRSPWHREPYPTSKVLTAIPLTLSSIMRVALRRRYFVYGNRSQTIGCIHSVNGVYTADVLAVSIARAANTATIAATGTVVYHNYSECIYSQLIDLYLLFYTSMQSTISV